MTYKLTRRDLLSGAAGAVGGAALGSFTETTHAQSNDTTKTPGGPPTELGLRSPHERRLRPTTGRVVSRTPHQELLGTITPSDLHYERHHAGVPEIDPAAYRLLVHGMVERRPKALSRRLPDRLPRVLGQLRP